MKPCTVTIIIPAYNEEQRIGTTLEAYCRFFRWHRREFKTTFSVVLNGCTDNTLHVAQRYRRTFPEIKILHFQEKIGKGGAIIEGIKASTSSLVGYVDADGSTPPEAFYDLARSLHSSDGIIASRWLPRSRVYPPQTFRRRLASRCFNFFVRVFFFLPYHDTQCGAKLFRRESLLPIVSDLVITQWAFDVNLLYLLQKNQAYIHEAPTVWMDKAHSKLHVFGAGSQMFLGLLRLRLLNSPLRWLVGFYDRLPSWTKIHRVYLR